MISTQVLNPLKFSLEDPFFAHAISLLKAGHLLAFPTETVYGLGASIFNEKAIQSIFTAKGRPQDNPLIAHISSLEQVSLIAKEIPEEFYWIASHFFPGPLTVVLKKTEKVPNIVCAGNDTIAFRMPSHQIALNLITHLGVPIVAPSANLSGKPSATCAAHVLEDFEGIIPAVMDGGPCKFGLESTVLSLLNPKDPLILRPGSITQTQIEQVLQREVKTIKKIDAHEKVISPGMKYRHYAPQAKVRLFSCWQTLKNYIQQNPSKKRKVLCQSHPFPDEEVLSLTPQNLYSHFRQADKENCQEVLILCDEQVVSDQALYNRLLKASE